jgi:hypothetical protein
LKVIVVALREVKKRTNRDKAFELEIRGEKITGKDLYSKALFLGYTGHKPALATWADNQTGGLSRYNPGTKRELWEAHKLLVSGTIPKLSKEFRNKDRIAWIKERVNYESYCFASRCQDCLKHEVIYLIPLSRHDQAKVVVAKAYLDWLASQ